MKTHSKARLAGQITSTLIVLLLLLDAIMKLLKTGASVQGTVDLGYPESTVFGIGLILLISTILYTIPRTSVIGAILITGYLGGAIATHVRVLSPLFSHTLFPVYVAVLVWGGLLLRNARVKAVFLRNHGN